MGLYLMAQWFDGASSYFWQSVKGSRDIFDTMVVGLSWS